MEEQEKLSIKMDKLGSDKNTQLILDKTTAEHLSSEASLFRAQCIEAIEDMGKEHLNKMKIRKGIKNSGGSDELSEQEVMAYFAFERKHSLSGWFIAPYDANQLIALFPCLHLRQGYHLESYQCLDKSGNGIAYVFVLPINCKLSKRPPEKALEYLFLADMDMLYEKSKYSEIRDRIFKSFLGILLPSYRALPAEANRNVELFLEGDKSPLSYYQASIYLREVYELGAIWHNVFWGRHKLIASPLDLPDQEWTWHEPEPEEWRPTVWKDQEQRWNVKFYTLNDMEAEFVLHHDRFTNGYEFEIDSTIIATYPGGYMV